MPLFMDVHRGVEGSTEEVAEAHMQDLEVQKKYGVEYKEYWSGPEEGVVFCLFEAPDKEAGRRVHEEAHGLVADEIFEVEQGE